MRLSLGAACLALALTLGACENEATAPGDGADDGQLTVDASSQTTFAYVNLATGQVVAVGDPSASTDWHLALRRFEVRLNGGVSGPGGVAGFNLENNVGATDQEIIGFTAEGQQAFFDGVDASSLPPAGDFLEDGLVPNASSWFFFNPGSGSLVADPSQAWKTVLGTDGYAVFRIAALTLNGAGTALETVTFEWRLQPTGGALGALEELTVDVSAGPAWVDFHTGAEVAPTGCGWDATVGPSFQLEVNADCDAGTFPLDPTEDFTALTTAADAPEYGPFVAGIAGAFPSDVEDNAAPFRYNLEGNNRLWPTLNVYFVRVGATVYKVQLIDYYSASGASGHPTLRYAAVR